MLLDLHCCFFSLSVIIELSLRTMVKNDIGNEYTKKITLEGATELDNAPMLPSQRINSE
jgi:hypothetical protein